MEASEPPSLREAIVYFFDLANCLKYMAAKRWPNGVTCPTCGSAKVGFLANQQRWQCSSRHPRRQFSVKTGVFDGLFFGVQLGQSFVW